VTIPAAAQQRTPEGAAAFSRLFLETASQAAVTASSKELRSLADPECVGCDAMADLVDGYARRHQHIDRSAMRVNNSTTRPGANTGEAVVDVTATDGPKALVSASGATIKRFPEAKIFFEIKVEWHRSAWQVKQLQVVQ
jgi:hypothetical protein